MARKKKMSFKAGVIEIIVRETFPYGLTAETENVKIYNSLRKELNELEDKELIEKFKDVMFERGYEAAIDEYEVDNA